MIRRPFARTRCALLPLAAVLLVGGCGGDSTGPDSPYDEDTRPENVTYAAHLVDRGVVIAEMTRTSTGLYLRDLEEGEGDPAEPGDHVFVGYTGWLPDGEVFDPGADPYDFTLGESSVIEGWHEGIEGMRVGGVRLLAIPWWLGYGASGLGVIPPYAPLVFEVELLSIE